MSTRAKIDEQANVVAIDEYLQALEELHEHNKFHDKQQQVIDAIFKHGKKRIFLRKGRKAGGTQTVLYPMIRIAKCFPGSACYIIGPTLKLEKEIIWKNNRLQKMIPPKWGVQFMDSETRAVFPNGSFIKVEGADNHNAMVGIEGDAFAFDEGKDHDPRAYKNCYPNLASRDALWIFCGAPPDNRHNFYYTLEQEIINDPDWFFLHWSSWDNPFLPGGAAWLQKEKDKYYKRGDWDEWENLYEARYVWGGKRTVIPSFRAEKHMIPLEVLMSKVFDERSKLRWYTVCDPGFATCFAVLFACINPFNGEVYCLNEIYETDREKLSVTQIWPRIREMEERLNPGGQWRRVYDSAAPGFPQEVKAAFAGAKPGFRPTVKEEGDETKFFRIINSLFHTFRCYLSTECKNLSWEIENYVSKKPSEPGMVYGEKSTVYPDENNHLLDDFRYLLKTDNYKYVEMPSESAIVRPDGRRIISIDEEIQKFHEPKKDWAKDLLDGSLDLSDDSDTLWN